MEQNTILKEVTASICKICPDLDEPSSITETSRLNIDLAIDSLDIIEIEMDLEKKFNIRFSDSEIESWKTVKDIVNSIQKNL